MVVLYYDPKQVFRPPPFQQMSTDLYEIWQASVVTRGINLWVQFYPDRPMGGSKPKVQDFVFCNAYNVS